MNRMFLIVFRSPDGSIDHTVAEHDEAVVRRHFDLLKETRSAEKLPVMELHSVEFGEPLETHTKELRRG